MNFAADNVARPLSPVLPKQKIEATAHFKQHFDINSLENYVRLSSFFHDENVLQATNPLARAKCSKIHRVIDFQQ
jgi:hypothetical protein